MEKGRLIVGEEKIVPVGVVDRVDDLDVHGEGERLKDKG